MTEQNNQLQSQIEAIEASGADSVPIEQVRELLDSVKGMFGSNAEAIATEGGNMYQEIGELAKYINNAKKELQSAHSDQIAGNDLPDASNQLDAIIKMTEAATGRIMDECERLQSVHALMRDKLMALDPPLDPDSMAAIDDAIEDAATSVTFIYEACNFQDVTGQRIQKVVKALNEIERQVLRMVVVFGLEQHDDLDDATKAELQEDADLLSGPALEGQGLDQDDIDDILNALL